MTDRAPCGPRAAAIVGPYLSGKTTLLEALLAAAGITDRKGSVRDGNAVGDDNPESRKRSMSTVLNVAGGEYLGEGWTFIDCPGSIELAQDALNALMVVDAAIVVVEPDPAKAVIVGPLLRFLDEHAIPHIIFLNKMDHPGASVKGMLAALQDVSQRPLVLREVPIRDGEAITGHIDLASERAFAWKADAPSAMIKLPENAIDREGAARTEMLETLADFDDHLLEELLEDVTPGSDEIYASLTQDFHDDKIVPVFFGAAEGGHGVHRLLKALRHETPDVAETAARLGMEPKGGAAARVFKTLHADHVGKLSVARVFAGTFADGDTVGAADARIGGLFALMGAKQTKVAKAGAGAVAAFGRLDDAATGTVLSPSGKATAPTWPEPLAPVYSLSVSAAKKGDEVKLTQALAKMADEDPAFRFDHSDETGELIISGQGEMHLLILLDRLQRQYGMDLSQRPPQVPYRETICKPVTQHARHRKQSGGHGEFGDVHLDIKPLPRGSGFDFADTITGGAVPKQYIPAVETGVKEALVRGPLGFPVVDVAVTLTDGQFHSVDSSEMAFKKAAAQAVRDAIPNAKPVLLEPICRVTISIPNAYASKMQRLASGRRGQIMGMVARDGWPGWDDIDLQLPQSEMHDLIIELRSMTAGAGTYAWVFDHLQEVTGKAAEQVVGARG